MQVDSTIHSSLPACNPVRNSCVHFALHEMLGSYERPLRTQSQKRMSSAGNPAITIEYFNAAGRAEVARVRMLSVFHVKPP